MTAAHASVAHLRVPGFGASPVAEQAAIKRRLEAAFSSAAGGIDERDRIVLETADGLAVVVLGNAQAALELANRWMQAAAPQVRPAIGLSHGPVKAIEGAAGGPTFVGGALSEASEAATMASAGGVLATRAFREALMRSAPGVGRGLAPAGVMTDDQHRSHELFAADEPTVRARRRRFLVAAAGIAVGIVAFAFPARWLIRHRDPAIVELDIKPFGDVSVDGVVKGRAPPLTSLELSPGKHTLEFRNPRYPAMQVELEVSAGERVKLAHSFTTPSTPPSSRSFKQRMRDIFR